MTFAASLEHIDSGGGKCEGGLPAGGGDQLAALHVVEVHGESLGIVDGEIEARELHPTSFQFRFLDAYRLRYEGGDDGCGTSNA